MIAAIAIGFILGFSLCYGYMKRIELKRYRNMEKQGYMDGLLRGCDMREKWKGLTEVLKEVREWTLN